MISPGLLSCEHSLNTLRYADRVKELAADTAEAAAKSQLNTVAVESGSCSPLMEEDSMQEDDLAQLRSLNASPSQSSQIQKVIVIGQVVELRQNRSKFPFFRSKFSNRYVFFT